VADGFGGGATRARKLEIMRDSRIGTYGAVALLLSFGIRLGAIAALDGVRAVFAGLIVAAVLGRTSIVLLLCLLPPARADGVAATMGKVPTRAWSVALLIAAVSIFLCFPFGRGLIVALAAFLTSLVLVRLGRRQIGGQTGDLLGSSVVLVECVCLSLMASGHAA
jgi:adenosylcobinamide-GDP ribazoletransferase